MNNVVTHPAAYCRSEEQRLEVSRALIDFQMETNEAKQEWANTKSVSRLLAHLSTHCSCPYSVF